MPKSYSEKRVKFLHKNEQREFLELAEKLIGKGKKGIALISKVSVRQISDWKNAKTTLSLEAFDKLLAITKIRRPTRIKILGRYSHVKSAGKKGLTAVLKKYGEFPKNEKLRKENWQKW